MRLKLILVSVVDSSFLNWNWDVVLHQCFFMGFSLITFILVCSVFDHRKLAQLCVAPFRKYTE